MGEGRSLTGTSCLGAASLPLIRLFRERPQLCPGRPPREVVMDVPVCFSLDTAVAWPKWSSVQPVTVCPSREELVYADNP